MVKSKDAVAQIHTVIEAQAKTKYKINAVVESYMKAIEEIINIPRLLACLRTVIKAGRIRLVMEEIVAQSRVEFNYPEQEAAAIADDIDEVD